MAFHFHRLEIPEVILIEAQARGDARGFFMETYKRSEFSVGGVPEAFVQDSYSHSTRGVLRGLHYQRPPKTQGKLVMVLKGEIFDVAVDIRRGSPTYAKWACRRLSGENRNMLYIPEGFAHGFLVLSEEADIIYKMTEEYAPALDGGIRWNDPQVGIHWPVVEPILSVKDARLPLLKDAGSDFEYPGTRIGKA